MPDTTFMAFITFEAIKIAAAGFVVGLGVLVLILAAIGIKKEVE